MSQTAPNSLIDPPTDDDRTRERLEQAGIETPFCEACGSPTTPVAEGHAMWLVCAATQEDRPFLDRVLSLEPLIGHTRRLVIDDLSERSAA